MSKSFSVQFSYLKNVIISLANNISNVVTPLQEKNPATYEINLANMRPANMTTASIHYFIVLQVLLGLIASQNKFVLLHSLGGKGN